MSIGESCGKGHNAWVKESQPAKMAVRSRKGILPLIPGSVASVACGVCWLFKAAGSCMRWEKLVPWDSKKLVERTLCPAA